jgi:hypothetical protein
VPASFDGNTLIFGRAPSSQTFPAPIRRQQTAFPGVHGRLDKPLGGSGGQHVVSGILEGTLAELIALEAAWMTYQATGIAAVLIDDRGRSWPRTIVTQYRPVGDWAPDGYGYFQFYEAILDSLI